MNIARFTFSAIVFLCLLSTAQVAADVEASVVPGYGGVCKIGCWNPVTVTLANPDSDIEGFASVSVRKGQQTVRYMAPVNLAQSAKKQFTVYVPLTEFSSEITVDILDGRRIIKRVQSRYRDAYEADYVLVTIGQEESALNFLSGLQVDSSGGFSSSGRRAGLGAVQIQVGHLDPMSIPDKPMGFDGANMLVLTNFESSRMDAAMLDSIRIWAASGGTVVVCGGADYARLKTPFFQEILPVDVETAVEAPLLDSLTAKYGFQLAAGKVYITKGSPKPGAAVMASQEGVPLITTGRYGLGNIVFLAFDPLGFPFKGWDGQTGMWKDIVLSAKSSKRINKPELLDSPGSPGYAGYRSSGYLPPGYPSIQQAALYMKATEPPSLGLVGFFLIGYILCLVPLNYFYLRKKNKFELAWLTTPVVILVFTLGAYAAGYAIRGGQTVMNRIAIVETASDTTVANVAGYLGIYSPGRTRYDIAIEDPMVIATETGQDTSDRYAPEPAVVIQAEKTVLGDMDMRQWTGRIVQLESGLKLKGSLESSLVYTDNRLKGKIANRTGFHLRDCTISFGDGRMSIGALPDGKAIAVDLDVKSTASAPPLVSAGYSADIRAQIAEQLNGRIAWCGEPVLAGWLEQSGLPAHIDGKKHEGENVGLALFHLKFKFSSDVEIPKGLISGTVVEQDSGVNFREENGRLIIDYVNDGYFVQDFRIIRGLETGFTPTKLVLTASYAGNTPAISCFNWKTGQWDTLPTATEIPIPDPAAHMRHPDGLIRVKFKVVGSVSGVNLQMTIKGRSM